MQPMNREEQRVAMTIFSREKKKEKKREKERESKGLSCAIGIHVKQ